MEVNEIQKLIWFQINQVFILGKHEEELLDEKIILEAVNNTQYCLQGMSNKYYEQQNGDKKINLYNSVMNCIFLYWLSRRLFLKGNSKLADKVYYLNKMLNSVELFYEVKLPHIWSCEHPLGSVMGRAEYGDYFYFYQGCTVGGNIKNDGTITYPQIGKHVKMFSNSKILGSSRIGNNVIISANCYVKDQDIPDHTIVFGQSPNLVFKDNSFVLRGGEYSKAIFEKNTEMVHLQ